MTVNITLGNMEFRACHGCYELEKVVGNRFVVDLELEAEIGSAARNDELQGSVNYLDVYQTVKEQMAITSDIIENVAYRIGEAIREKFPQVNSAKVTVAKIAPPLGGKVGRVSVTIVC